MDWQKDWCDPILEHELLLGGSMVKLLVDESIHYYTPSNENQYGPYRVGPAFPFNVNDASHRPDPPGVHFGYKICFVHNYHDDGSQAAPYCLRRPDEIARCKKALLRKECKNAEAAIALVERDSALGFEPSMEYIGGADAIRWKLQHLDVMLRSCIPAYRRR